MWLRHDGCRVSSWVGGRAYWWWVFDAAQEGSFVEEREVNGEVLFVNVKQFFPDLRCQERRIQCILVGTQAFYWTRV